MSHRLFEDLNSCKNSDGSVPLEELEKYAGPLGRAARAAGKQIDLNPFWSLADGPEQGARNRWNNAWMSEHIRIIREGEVTPIPEEILAS